MRAWLRDLSLFLLFLVIGVPNVWGDIPGPGRRFRPPPPGPIQPVEEKPVPPAILGTPAVAAKSIPFVVRASEETKNPRIQISNKVLQDLRSASAAHDEHDSTGLAGLRRLQTVIVGSCLAVSLTLGGLWLTRSSGRRVYFGLAVLLATGLTTLGLSCLPWQLRSDSPQPLTRSHGTLAGRATLAVTGTQNNGEGVELQINRDVADDFVKH